MGQSRVEKKAVLMREAERLIEELLEGEAQNEKSSRGEMEGEILEIGREILKSVLRGQASMRPVPCKEGGKAMRYKGLKGKQVGSFEWGYFYCEGCGAGIYPPG